MSIILPQLRALLTRSGLTEEVFEFLPVLFVEIDFFATEGTHRENLRNSSHPIVTDGGPPPTAAGNPGDDRIEFEHPAGVLDEDSFFILWSLVHGSSLFDVQQKKGAK